MPGILDLPVELNAHRTNLCELHRRSLSRQRSSNGYSVLSSSDSLQLGLTNHYIERTTRRVFAPVHFTIWSIKMPNDVLARKFCDMASTPDLGN